MNNQKIKMEHLKRKELVPLTAYKFMEGTKVVGWYNTATQVAEFKRNPTHIFHKKGGLGISTKIIEDLTKLGCQKIRIQFFTGNNQYKEFWSTLETWKNRGQYWENGPDQQLILNFKEFNNETLRTYNKPTFQKQVGTYHDRIKNQKITQYE